MQSGLNRCDAFEARLVDRGKIVLHVREQVRLQRLIGGIVPEVPRLLQIVAPIRTVI